LLTQKCRLEKVIFIWRPTVYVQGQGLGLGLSQLLLLPAGAGAGGGGEEEGGGGAEEGAEEGQAPAQTVRAQDQEHRRGAEASGTVYIQCLLELKQYELKIKSIEEEQKHQVQFIFNADLSSSIMSSRSRAS
jgi:hypothetical protein